MFLGTQFHMMSYFYNQLAIQGAIYLVYVLTIKIYVPKGEAPFNTKKRWVHYHPPITCAHAQTHTHFLINFLVKSQDAY